MVLIFLVSWLRTFFSGNGKCKTSSAPCDYSLKHIPPAKIISNPYQARRDMDKDSLQQLAHSLKSHGIINPIIVTPSGNSQYQLIAGERRVRSSKLAGFKKIPALVGEFSEEEMVEVSFLENLQREPMNVVELARIYKRLRSEFKRLSIEELSDLVGKSPEEITRYDWVLELPNATQKALSKRLITEDTAQKMLPLDSEEQKEILSMLGDKEVTPSEIDLKIYQYREDNMMFPTHNSNNDDEEVNSTASSGNGVPPELSERAG